MLIFILPFLSIFHFFLILRAIPEKIPGRGGGNGRRYIFLWVVGAERFQIIWVIGVRPNQITWVGGFSLGGRGRKNIICQKRETFYQI